MMWEEYHSIGFIESILFDRYFEPHIMEKGHVIEGTQVCALPSPSGLNAHYSVEDLASLFGKLCMNI